MSKVLNEQLSAFLDDELEIMELQLVARRLAADPELRETAMSYSVIGDVLRGELPAINPAAFGRDVARHLDGPVRVPAAGGVSPFWRKWGRSLAGVGVAAVVAVVAVVSLQVGDPVSQGAPALTVPVAEQSPVVPAYTVPTAFSRRAGAPDQLSRYYLNHSEYALLLGGQGSLVRIVSGPLPEQELEQEERADEPALPAVTTEP